MELRPTKCVRNALAVLALLAGAAPASEFPRGTIAADLGGREWSIRYEAGGTYAVLREDEVVAEGKYEATGDELVMIDETGAGAEPGKKGKYTWKLDGRKLTFTKVEDEVQGRVAALTHGPWTLED